VPCGQAEVRMYDFEAAHATQVARGAQVVAGAELVQLDVGLAGAAQRGDLRAHERAARRIGRAGGHVADDKRAHLLRIVVTDASFSVTRSPVDWRAVTNGEEGASLMYRLMGLAHAGLYRTYRTLSADRGQGTVEYVALILLVAGIFAAVVSAGGGNAGATIAHKISSEIQAQINSVGGK
jgi:hypothetical protein